MRRPIVLAALLVIGCQERPAATSEAPQISIKTREGGTIDAADGKLAIAIPGLDAKMNLPDFRMGAEHFDIGGVRLPANSRVTGITVDPDKGVVMRFANPAPPAAVLDHFRTSGVDNGFVVAAATRGLRLSDADREVAIAAEPDGAGSRGSLTVRHR